MKLLIAKSHCKRDDQRHGFSLVEVVISTFLVGTIIIASMRALGSSLRANERTHQRGRAVMLADGLMAEIQRQSYSDSSLPVFGREADETSSNRTQHDDVDDYDDWVSSPPIQIDGTSLVGIDDGWERSVEVTHLDPETLLPIPDATNLGIKQVIVRVKFNGELLVELQAVKTSAFGLVGSVVTEPAGPVSGAGPPGGPPGGI